MAPFTIALLLASASAALTYAQDDVHDDAVAMLQAQIEERKMKPTHTAELEPTDEYNLADPMKCTSKDSVPVDSKAASTQSTIPAAVSVPSPALLNMSETQSDDPPGAGAIKGVLQLGTILLVLDCIRRWQLESQDGGKQKDASQEDQKVEAAAKSAWVEFINAIRTGDARSFDKALCDDSLLNRSDAWGCTPLHFAAAGGSTTTTTALLKRGVDVNALDAVDETPLHIAACAGHTSICQLLLGAGANINAVNKQGETPLLAAGRTGHAQTCRLLADNGAGLAGVADVEVPPLVAAQLVRKVLAA